MPDIQEIPRGTGSHIGGHLDANDRLLQEGFLKSAEPLRERFILRQRFFPPVREVQGTAWSLATVSATNYFHWMFECLPRLRFLREANIPYDWIYACHNQRFQREAFALSRAAHGQDHRLRICAFSARAAARSAAAHQ